jgi:hypothetical protein
MAAIDNPASESPIYIDNVSHRREHSYRALAADGHHWTPFNPSEEGWNQLSAIPRDPPELGVNMGPGTGVVELVAMVLAPVAGSKLKWEFVSWAGTGPPAAPNVSHPLSRVIPATFGLGEAYQPTLTGAPAYDGHSWIVDGLNHYVEFPYGPPPGLPDDPVLTFYRYTGTTGGNLSNSTDLYINRAATPGLVSNIMTAPLPANFIIGGAGGYEPANRIIAMEKLAPGGIFSFEASGLLVPAITGTSIHHFQFGIMVGDDYNIPSRVMGLLDLEINIPTPNAQIHGIYKLTATRNEFVADSFIWTAKMSATTVLVENLIETGTGTVSSSAADASHHFYTGNIPQTNDGLQFAMYINCTELVPGAGTMLVIKYNHLFKRVA